MDMLKKKNYLGIAAIVLMLLGVVLPYYKVEFLGISQGVSLIKSWEGWILILMAFYSALVVFKTFFEEKLPFVYNSAVTGAMGKIKGLKGAKGLLIPAGICVLIMIYLHVSVRKSLAGPSTFINLNDIVKYGIGFYTEILGVICLAVHAFLYEGEDGTTTQPAPTVDVNQQPMNNMQQPQQPMYNQPMNNMQQPMDNNNQFPGNNGF